MTRADLRVGMMVVTENGKKRLVMPTKNDGLVLVSEDNKFLKVAKMNNDLTRGRYRVGNDVVEVYDIMDDVDSELFDYEGRELLFDKAKNFDVFGSNVEDTEDADEVEEIEEIEDDEEDCECDNDCGDCSGNCGGCSDCNAEATDFTKADVTAGMLAVTRDGQNRLAIPTADMGLVLATEDSKFIRMDKLNDDLTIADYRKDGKNVDQVYSVAKGLTTDFYSTEGRELLFKR